METMETNFITLLGSAEAAKARMQELADFAQSTPFDVPGVAQASRTLETLTRGALSTGAGLTLVGDVASGTGVPFEDLAVTVARAGGKPRLSDLRESGSIEQDADLVGLLVRSEYYAEADERGEVEGEAELVIAKQRNGPVGEVPLTFRKEFTRFENRSRESGEGAAKVPQAARVASARG